MKTIKTNMLKQSGGFALPSILMLSTVITTVLTLFIMVFVFTNKIELKTINKKKLDLACESYLTQYLSGAVDLTNGSSLINLKASKELFGLYEKLIVTADGHSDSSSVEYNLGYMSDQYFSNALNWTMPDLRASYAGNVRITGDITLTSNKIERSRILGINKTSSDPFSGKLLITDSINTKLFKESLLLEQFYDTKILKNIDTTISSSFILSDKTADFLRNYSSLQITNQLEINSFNLTNSLPTKSIFADGDVKITTETDIEVYISIIASGDIEIQERCSLKNITISTPGNISISKNCLLENAQIFGMGDIYIEDSQFNFPSVIAAYVDLKDSTAYDNKVLLKNTKINGTVLLVCSETGDQRNRSRIEFLNGSIVHGVCYSENAISADCRIYGSVYTYNFWFYKKPTEYINWLVNTEINRLNLNPNFLLPAGFGENINKMKLSEKWLY